MKRRERSDLVAEDVFEILDVDDGNDFAIVEDGLQVSPCGDDGDAVDFGSGDVCEVATAREEGSDADEHVVAFAIGRSDMGVFVGENGSIYPPVRPVASMTTRWRPHVALADRDRNTRSECRRDGARCLWERRPGTLLFSRSRRALLEGWWCVNSLTTSGVMSWLLKARRPDLR